MYENFFERLLRVSGFRGFALNILLGALSVLGHAPFYIWPITLLCFALLMLRLDKTCGNLRHLRSSFLSGFSFGFGYFLAGLYWIGSAFIARGPEFIPYMPFAILAMTAGLAVFWGMAGLVYVRLSYIRSNQSENKSLWSAGIFASVFFIVEFLRGHIFSGFPWNLPGYIFAAGQPISQIASITGIYGLTALVFLLSASLALVMKNRQQWRPAAFFSGVVFLCFGYGAVRLANAENRFVENVSLRIVHADIKQRDKFDPNKYVSTANTYLQLSLSEGFENATHIIWPEGAIPGLMFEDKALMAAIDTLFRSGDGAPPILIAQTLRAEKTALANKPAYYNSAAAVTFKDGQVPEISPFYDKQKLVPFGEFIPGRGVLERVGLKTLSTAFESMSPGKGGDSPTLPNLPPVSLQICYEIIFPGFTSRSGPHTGQRPTWILNLSNDAWYGNSTGPRQHINQARYRAIEQGIPVVRSTSGGVSGVIDPFGRQINQMHPGDHGVIDAKLPKPLVNTTFRLYINYIILLLILILLIVCVMGKHKET